MTVLNRRPRARPRADGVPAWSTTAGTVDEVGFRYSALIGKWCCQGWKLGFS